MDNYFRCPWCGSSAVSTETKKEGYDIKKGLIGTALFGTGGAVMGINMNEKKYNYCQMCRKTFTQCMPVATIKDIERLLRDSNGDHPLLKMYKNHYPNFEMDNFINTNNNSSVNITELNAEELADTIYEYCKKNQIKEIKKDALEKRIAGEWLPKGYDALNILEERGVAEYNSKKSNSDDGMWYNFYLTEEEIEQKVIREGGLDDEILANKIYHYCKENYITKQSKEKLFIAIANGDIFNGEDALVVLEERGLAKEINDKDGCYYEFFLDEEKIKLAKERIRIANGELTDEELADTLYEYCKKHQIKEIEKNDLNNRVAGEWIENSYEALEILEERGVVKRNSEKSASNGGMWYKFYFTEKEIQKIKEKKKISDGELEDNELADLLYECCKKNNVSYIEETALYKLLLDEEDYIPNGRDALRILKQKGLCTLNTIQDNKLFYEFYYDEKQIELAKEKIKNTDADLNVEEFADKIYQCYKANSIFEIEKNDIYTNITNGFVDNLEATLYYLTQEGLGTYSGDTKFKFYFDEEEIKLAKEKVKIANGELTDEELADTLYEYCKKNNISSIIDMELCEKIANSYIENFIPAMDILMKKGLATYNMDNNLCQFYLDKEEIYSAKKRIKIANGELTDEELADTLYEYCKKHQIKEIEKNDLNNRVAGQWIKNTFEALNILEERGVVEYNFEKSDSNDGMWYNFYFDSDEIDVKENITENKEENSTDSYEEIKKLKELLDLEIITQEEFDKKKKELLNL